MNALNRWLNEMRPKQPYYKAADGFGDRLMISENFATGTADVLSPKGVSEREWNWFCRTVLADKERAPINWVLARFFCNGPKVFCPTPREYEALLRTNANFDAADYRQPFDVLTFVAPECHRSGNPNRDHICAILRYDQANSVLGACVILSDGSCVPVMRVFFPTGASVESYFDDVHHNRTDALSEAEAVKMSELIIAGMNACMLLSQFTARCLGRANQQRFDKLQKSLSKPLSNAARAANETEMLMIPEVYGFDQHIVVYDEIEAGDHAPSGERAPHKPHWRRGHWANQPCGEGHRERKLIFRRPAFVNAHLFAGELSDTRVTMSLAQKSKGTDAP